MTDKELLEKAAKAAGYVEWDWLANDGNLNVYNKEGRQEAWNPLIDDGDALRLAVRLCLLNNHEVAIAPVNVWHGDNPYAATRRAIVRAAAAIGEQL